MAVNVYEIAETGGGIRCIKGQMTQEEAVRYMIREIAKKDGPVDLFACEAGDVTSHAYYEPNPDDGPTVVVHYIETLDIDKVAEQGIEAFADEEFIDAEYFTAEER